MNEEAATEARLYWERVVRVPLPEVNLLERGESSSYHAKNSTRRSSQHHHHLLMQTATTTRRRREEERQRQRPRQGLKSRNSQSD
jgi:hypothetical protein